MLDRQLHKFYISFKLNGKIHVEWIKGINLRHAKDKIEFEHPDATDLMDWTQERPDDLKKYLDKNALRFEFDPKSHKQLR